MNVATLLHATARRAPDAPAVSTGLQLVHSYAGLRQRSAALAAGLRSLGLASGDRVALVMSNCAEFFEIMWASWEAGLCIVPVNARLHTREIAYVFDHAKIKCCFATGDLMTSVATAAQSVTAAPFLFDVRSDEYRRLFSHEAGSMQQVDGGSPAWIFYTSGTTGRPKGAVLSHASMFAMTWRYFADIDKLSPDDSLIHGTPMSHATGLFSIPHVAKGSHHVVCDAPIGDAGAILELVNHYSSTSFVLSPSILMAMTSHPGLAQTNVENIKTILYGSAPIHYKDLTRALAAFGPRLWQGFGQGETPVTFTHLDQYMHGDARHPRYAERLASVGVARTGVEVRVVDADGRTLPADEIGEIVCKSDVTMTGYLNDAVATSKAIRDGWLYSGDLGSMDTDGFVTLKDRAKDLIITDSLNVYPKEVENALLSLDRVKDAAVVGQADTLKGETIVAFVVADPSVTSAELLHVCQSNLADYKWPTTFVIVHELPRNSGGKVLKSELRNRLLRTTHGNDASVPDSSSKAG
jgi:long-chain acyl-CoA synthetase